MCETPFYGVATFENPIPTVFQSSEVELDDDAALLNEGEANQNDLEVQDVAELLTERQINDTEVEEHDVVAIMEEGELNLNEVVGHEATVFPHLESEDVLIADCDGLISRVMSRGRGRPRKNLNDRRKYEKGSSKGRGRPRKESTGKEVVVFSDISDSQENELVKRKPGRPRKKNGEDVDKSKKVIKRNAGRPRKRAVDEDIGASSSEIPAGEQSQKESVQILCATPDHIRTRGDQSRYYSWLGLLNKMTPRVPATPEERANAIRID